MFTEALILPTNLYDLKRERFWCWTIVGASARYSRASTTCDPTSRSSSRRLPFCHTVNPATPRVGQPPLGHHHRAVTPLGPLLNLRPNLHQVGVLESKGVQL
jgi:hypothetical protein